MSNTSSWPHCDKCGAALSGYAESRFCAACLLESAILEPESAPAAGMASAPLLALEDYELLEEIARGGMGVVYRARQTSLNRPVAIKMILGGHLANAAELKRFRAEAETAAQLRHPNIVAIHEVGEHAGQPFFSMELVQGQNLAQLVREEPLPSRKAAAYLKAIAEAVQYAHSRGVLHRDLKPSNVLIDEHDQPRITDFGLAKRLTDSQLSTNDPQLTQTGQVLGSPSFIPPEQAAGLKQEIGPPSDVYSLGAILYHCLTARPPFMAENLTQTLRLVAEQEPVSPRLLNPSVPRDLETICLKCLEKDPGRRYPTAQALADELTRFLNHEPIHAHPLGAMLKVHRWCVRNRPLAIAGTAALALLMVVAIGSPIALLRIDRERRQAKANEQKARTEAEKSRQVAQFLRDMLKSAGPSVARGRDDKVVREILETTSARVSKELNEQPEVQGDIYFTVGTTYLDIGDHPRAATNLQQAVASYRLAGLGDHTNLAITLSALGACQSFTGDVDRGRSNAWLGLEMARRCGDSDVLFICLGRYGGSLGAWGQFSTKSEPYLREAYELKKRMGNDPVGLASAMHLYSGFLTNAEDGERMLRDGLDLFRKHLPPGHPKTIQGVFSLGQHLLSSGKSDEAERVLREALSGFHTTHNPNHPYQSIVLRFLAEALLLQGKGDEAESVVREQVSATPTHGGHQDLLYRVVAFRRACALDAEILKNIKGDFLMQDWIHNQGDKIASFARSGRWQEAITELAKVIEDGTANHLLFHLLAPLLVASGDAEGYRRHCERIQVQFVATRDPLVAERMAKACLILPGSGVDFQKLDQWVRIAMTADTNDSLFQYSQFVSGLAAYRQNDCTRASEILQPLLNHPSGEPYPRIEAWTVLAMANHKLNRIEEARTALTNGLDLARTKLPQIEADDLGVLWNDWVVVLALFREARTLIEGNDPGETAYKPAEAALFAARPQDRWRVYGRAGRWSEAATSLKQSIESEPNDAAPYLRLVPILLLNGDLAGYQKLCSEIVARFSDSKDIGTADSVAKTCTLHPESGVDFKAAAEAADTAVALGRQSEFFPWFALCKSLAEYRQEHFAEAATWAQTSLATVGQLPERDAADYLVLAMAKMRLNQTGAAREALAQGAELVEKKLPKLDRGDVGNQWVDVVIANVLLREARATTEGKPVPASQP